MVTEMVVPKEHIQHNKALMVATVVIPSYQAAREMPMPTLMLLLTLTLTPILKQVQAEAAVS